MDCVFGAERRGHYSPDEERRAALNGEKLKAGDGAAVSEERLLEIETADESEVLLFGST